jgi:hypothetical protein
VDKGQVFIDLELLKVTALEHYVAMLDRARFEPRVVNQLVAGMAAYEVPGRSSLGLDRLKSRVSP